jgi:hypothetical protein
MAELLTRPFVRLVATSPQIEQLPFVRRPRTMAAAWGGLLVCKLAAMVLVSPTVGAQLFAITFFVGIGATYARFGFRDVAATGEGPVLFPA